MGVELRGHTELSKILLTAANMKAIKEVVKKQGGDLQKSAMKKAIFNKGYATGATKDSIKLTIENNGMSARVKAGTEYSGLLEVGTRFMEAQPFMKPALEEIGPKFETDLRRAGLGK